jgi:predicted nucleic acid-binding protein
MKKSKLYIDTSVLNFALTNEESLVVYKKATLDLLEEIQRGKYEIYISDLVLVEINRAPRPKAELLKGLLNKFDIRLLSLTEEIEGLADKYIAEGLIPRKYRDDALHIAIASFNNLDAVVSWNFQHMVKLKTKQGVIAVNSLLGYKSIEIVSPQEVV